MSTTLEPKVTDDDSISSFIDVFFNEGDFHKNNLFKK